MRSLEIPNLPDALYDQIEKLARVRGKSPADVAADLLHDALSSEVEDEHEARLLAEIRAGREQMAREGICLTEADIQRAKTWGRE